MSDEPEATAEAACDLDRSARSAQEQGRYDDAERLYRRALDLRTRAFGPHDPAVIMTLQLFASLYEDAGRYADAEAAYRRALATHAGPDDWQVAATLERWARLCQAQGRLADAEPLRRRALRVRESEAEAVTLADALLDLAELYAAQGRHAEAEPLFRRALALFEVSHGADAPGVAVTLGALARSCAAQGRRAEAETLGRRAVATAERVLYPAGAGFSGRDAFYPRVLRLVGRTGEAVREERRLRPVERSRVDGS